MSDSESVTDSRWLDDREQSLEFDYLDLLDKARASAALAVCQQVQQQWSYIAPAGKLSLSGDYSGVLQAMAAIYTPVLDGFIATVRTSILDVTGRSYLFGYYGGLWQLSQTLPAKLSTAIAMRTPNMPAVQAAILAPWEGDDLPGRLAKLVVDTRNAFRRVTIEAMAAEDDLDSTLRRLAATWDVRLTLIMQEARRPHRRPAARVTKSQLESRLAGLVAGESVHARSMGTARALEDNPDLVKGWVWTVSEIEPPPVCDRCMYYRGREFIMGSDSVKPPLHPHCRCRAQSIIRSLRQLGVSTVDAMPARKSYPDWAAGAGSKYDGGLAGMPLRRTRKGGVTISLPRSVPWMSGA